MISENSTIQKADDFLMSIIDHEAVILGIETGMYVGLNEMATEIWSAMDKPVRVSELIDSLADQYDEERILIRDQVLDFLNTLSENKLVEVTDEE